MFIMSNFFAALAWLAEKVFSIYGFIVIARALISWVSPDPYNPIVQFLIRVTEPLLAPIRRLLPAMPIDISPIILLLLLQAVQIFVVRTLYSLAA